MRPLYTPADPFRDAVRLVAGREPPWWVRGWALAPDDADRLQAWFVEGMESTATPWATGIGAIEAAELIVAAAIENGNIWHPSDSRWAEVTP